MKEMWMSGLWKTVGGAGVEIAPGRWLPTWRLHTVSCTPLSVSVPLPVVSCSIPPVFFGVPRTGRTEGGLFSWQTVGVEHLAAGVVAIEMLVEEE